MLIEVNSRSWQANDAEDLTRVLAWRDSRGGGVFWLCREDAEYPCLAIRVSGNVADVHYFPTDGHPGFQCLGGEGLTADGETILAYEGCDPSTGEPTR